MRKRFAEMILLSCLALLLYGAGQLKADQSSIGPFELADVEGVNKIRFQFAGQLWLYHESRDNGPGNDRSNGMFMKARRVRLSLNGNVLDPDLSFKLHLSAAPKSLELMDIYANYKINDRFQVRFGQYKVPFTRYRIQSFQRLTFIDWAIITKYFGAERQMGFALHNGYEKPPAWGYAVGVFTGVNARASHAVGLAAVYGEKTANPSDLAEPGAPAEYHPELFIHISRNAKNIQVNSNTDAEKEDLRYSVGISAAWDLDPDNFQDFRARMASEFLIKYRGVAVLGVGCAGYSDVNEPLQTELTMLGGLAQSSCRIGSSYEICLRYSIVDIREVLTDYALLRAQRLIDDSGNDPDLVQQYQNAGNTYREQEITLGFNRYIIEHFLKWQIDFGWLRHSRFSGTRNDFLTRSQFQLTF